MLAGKVLTSWHDVLSKWDGDPANKTAQTWEAFKTTVSQLILTKLCPPDDFAIQVWHMMEQ